MKWRKENKVSFFFYFQTFFSFYAIYQWKKFCLSLWMLGLNVMSFRFLMRQLKNASYEVKTPSGQGGKCRGVFIKSIQDSQIFWYDFFNFFDVYRIEICGVFSGGRRLCVMILWKNAPREAKGILILCEVFCSFPSRFASIANDWRGFRLERCNNFEFYRA